MEYTGQRPLVLLQHVYCCQFLHLLHFHAHSLLHATLRSIDHSNHRNLFNMLYKNLKLIISVFMMFQNSNRYII